MLARLYGKDQVMVLNADRFYRLLARINDQFPRSRLDCVGDGIGLFILCGRKTDRQMKPVLATPKRWRYGRRDLTHKRIASIANGN
ncbi:hypothetical protein CR152_27650 [Massilia violaceinigra]|uniref:Uncharacterized protein n=1 Tax=Massilia violaceinigra TaxID=2045208 RepID=A0A2D2DSA7_9BURK|nr:hypothetical protein CR152_27650 [Massilia violaceinigra]